MDDKTVNVETTVFVIATATVSMSVTNQTDEISIRWNDTLKQLTVTEWAYNKRTGEILLDGMMRKPRKLSEIENEFYDYRNIKTEQMLTEESLFQQHIRQDPTETSDYKKVHDVPKK